MALHMPKICAIYLRKVFIFDVLHKMIADVMGIAAEQANQHPKDVEGNTVFTVPELHWFRKNAYNMGVAKCDTWELFHIIRIFKTCLAFSTCYPKDLPSSEATDIAMMALRCHFVIAAALVSLARKEDKVEEQLQYYLQVRHHMDEFYAILETDTDEIMDESTAADLNAKLSTLFVFDFEAATVLRDWDGLNEIVRKARTCRDEVMYKAMGDCVLRSKAPGKGQGYMTICLAPLLEDDADVSNSSLVFDHASHHQ